tara:strand:- start:15476 stop:15724 length:249 start_codon:yes stop_codon:yes gene_type:complete
MKYVLTILIIAWTAVLLVVCHALTAHAATGDVDASARFVQVCPNGTIFRKYQCERGQRAIDCNLVCVNPSTGEIIIIIERGE